MSFPQLALIFQVDVLRVGVGGGFLQNDQPVVFDSNILQATKQCISHSHLQMPVVTRSFVLRACSLLSACNFNSL